MSTSRQQDLGAGRPAADALPFRADPWTAPRTDQAAPVRLSEGLLVAALARLAAADSRADVATAALPLLLDEPGVRACAVLQREGDRLVVLGSAGYDCDTMAAGAWLPLDAGLPVTEAVRTGRLVERGTGPAWVAVPFPGARTAGALLLSLTAAPPQTPREVAALRALTSAFADALRRARAQERTFLSLALVTASLAPPREVPGRDAAVRSLPLDGVVGGDVALRLPDGRGGTWLVVADACRSGLEAAVTARTLHAAVTALATRVDDAGALLGALEAVLASADGGGEVTACAVRVSGRRVEVASAGHPLPVVLTDCGAQLVDMPVGPPLGSGSALSPSTVLELSDGAVLAVHTDGLTVRGRAHVRLADLLPERAPDDLELLADRILQAADASGPAEDDVALLLVRVEGTPSS